MNKEQYNSAVKGLNIRLDKLVDEFQEVLELAEQSPDLSEEEKQDIFESELGDFISTYHEI